MEHGNEEVAAVKHVDHGLNILKFIAMILVFFIHCKFKGYPGEIIVRLCSCAVPLFFMVSGYLSNGRDDKVLFRRGLRLVRVAVYSNILYLIWDIAYEYVCGRNPMVFLRESLTVKKLVVFLVTNESPIRGHLWYLGAAAYCYLLAGTYLRIFRKECLRAERAAIAISVVLIIGNIVISRGLTKYGLEDKMLIACRNFMLDGIPFFLLGAYCREHLSIFKEMQPSMKKIIVIALIIVNIVEILIADKDYVLYISTAFLCMALIKAVSGSCGDSKALVGLGNFAAEYGLMFYIIQVMVIKSFEFIPVKILGISESWIAFIWPFLCALLTFVITVCLKYCLDRLYPGRNGSGY